MSADSRSNFRPSRRSVLQGATLAPVSGAVLAEESSAMGLCLEWLRTDAQLESLTLAWSQLETAVLANRGQESSRQAPTMRRLERQIDDIDRLRSGLIERIVASPSTSAHEAIGKLLVAQRLLAGEGGTEHALVADALSQLAGESARIG